MVIRWRWKEETTDDVEDVDRFIHPQFLKSKCHPPSPVAKTPLPEIVTLVLPLGKGKFVSQRRRGMKAGSGQSPTPKREIKRRENCEVAD